MGEGLILVVPCKWHVISGFQASSELNDVNSSPTPGFAVPPHPMPSVDLWRLQNAVKGYDQFSLASKHETCILTLSFIYCYHYSGL